MNNIVRILSKLYKNFNYIREYESNLTNLETFIDSNYDYVDFYLERIKNIVSYSPYNNMPYRVYFSECRDVTFIFRSRKRKVKVKMSSDVFGLYSIYNSSTFKELYAKVINPFVAKKVAISKIDTMLTMYNYRVDDFLRHINTVLEARRTL